MRSMTSEEKVYAIRFGGIMSIAGSVLLLDRFSKAWIREIIFNWERASE